MLPYRDSRLTLIALVIFFVLALGYAYFEARGLLFGPVINVPAETTVVHEQLVIIQGSAERITSLSLNGAQIPVAENGAFSQPYLLQSGYNRIILDAKDSYGRTSEKVLEIVYQPASTSAASSGQTTTSTAGASSTPQ